MNIVDKILIEASYEGDMKMRNTAKEILRLARTEIEKYPDTQNVKYDKNHRDMTVMANKIIIRYFDKRTTYPDVQEQQQYTGARYFPDHNMIWVFNCTFDRSKENKKIIVTDLQDEVAFHEIIHLLDNKRSKDPKAMSQSVDNIISADDRTKEYINDPFEYNAHFMEIVMPKIEKAMENANSLPKTFDEFKKEIINKLNSEGDGLNLYDKLRKTYKQKFLKRLYVIYTGFQQAAAKGNHNTDDVYDLSFAKPAQKKSLFQKIISKFKNETSG